MLGYILTSGPEQMRDLEEAHRWYERSAAAGCPQGALGYALSLARTATDPEQQAQVAEISAPCGGCRVADRACTLLGMMTERGIGMPADRARRDPVVPPGGGKGQPAQPGPLGHGPDGRRDAFRPTRPEGESWLRRAALAGDPEAAAVVGDLYAKGGKLPPNYAEAAIWFRRAAEAGHRGGARAWACCT